MRCPFCGADDTRVIDSRPTDGGRTIRRRRLCENCAQRFTTYEHASLPLLVRKRSGYTEPFDLTKVRAGLERSLAGRLVAGDAVDAIVDRVQLAARRAAPEISSEEIGTIVLAGLKEIDEAAYLRFASVYKDFQGASDFEKEMAALEGESGLA